jgi:hypothetical protein
VVSILNTKGLGIVMSKKIKIGISSVFRFLTGDVNWLDYGGKWYRKVADTRYHVIDLTNMWDATGDKSAPQYNVSLLEVDITSLQLKNAISGYDEDLQDNELVKVDALASYGAGAPLWTQYGGNSKKLLAEARGESRSLDDPEKYEEAMSRPVNAIGSTAREYAAGDFQSAITRGVERGNANAKLMAKLHGMPSEPNNTSIPSDNTIMFGTLHEDGSLTDVKNLNRDNILRCRFVILTPEHYREDMSCKCSNREHRTMMIQKWKYTEEQFDGIPIVD